MQKIIFRNSRGRSLEFKNSRPFILTKIEGTGCPQTTILTSKTPNQDGKTHHGTTIEERILTIEGAIFADNVADMYKKRQELCSIFNPKLKGTLTYTNDNSTHEIECTIDSSPTFKESLSNIQHFLIQLFCPNPFWTDELETKKEIAVWMGDFSFPLELIEDGIEMGHRESSFIVNINNSGDVETGMRIELVALATVVNPFILNVDTQEYIKIKRTLVVGDRLVINTHFANINVELIKDNITSNVLNYIDLNSTFLQLEIGDNLLRYDADSGSDNLEVSIYYNPLVLGV
jgi:hypothetical protein